jgi:hypothetical protein
MFSLRRIAIGSALLLAAAPAAMATQYSLDANLDPFQEVPPHNTPGYGSADLTYDSTAQTLSIVAGTGQYADLLAGATSVVIQDAPVGMNGPTLLNLTLDTPGNTNGTFSGLNYDVSGWTMQQLSDLLNGNTYINIRDSVFPSGEIRGQIYQLPEPASIGLLALSATSLLTRRRGSGR